ncbi:glucose-1-phosphate adenylyltransferase [Spirochaeta isovalerica]|uniref:Glucose-1-phosphate adenylyltransferase n=1 Tax=Spirochaeta isovalerica TaxID=150 RepID=A0A841R693_9SPIO|nr:glucose-1-phosphate adenylyltransferase [Spirochaeta isovalerica]MBB6478677.1 glucose-1-phosphate adenylyltransferase [Spirochaeta isovalerica]
MAKVLSLILGGGKGTRLYPLTQSRSKPAVPFGGKFRLVDIPISNCINSGFRQIYILTQFNSASLHTHINTTYKFDNFSKGFIEILAAEQTFEHDSWYEGTADAVRKNFQHYASLEPDYYLILSGDQLYKMDLESFLDEHIKNGADVSIASTPVTRRAANDLGIVKIDETGKIIEFHEKPGPDKDISDLKIPPSQSDGSDKEYLASMGIYIFNASAMEEGLDNKDSDFGKQIIPSMISTKNVHAYTYKGYWEDIGKISDFFDATLNLATPVPQFNLYDEENPIYTKQRDLPPSKINSCTINSSLATEGSIITDSYISNSVIGIRTIIDSGATLDGVYCMGADRYETLAEKEENRRRGIPNIGIGSGSIIKGAIIDKDVRIGSACRIGVDKMDRKDGSYENYHIIDGIIVIPKKTVIPDGTII